MTYTTWDVALERNGTLRRVKFKVWVSRRQVAAGFQLLAPFIYSNPSMISNISLWRWKILVSNPLSVVAASQPRMFQPHISTINHEIQSKSHEMRVKSAPWNCQRYKSENVYIKFAHLVACYVITTVPQIKHNRILQSTSILHTSADLRIMKAWEKIHTSKIPCPSRDPQDFFWSDQDCTALTLTCVQMQNMSRPQIYNNVLNIRTVYQHHRHSNIFHLPRQRGANVIIFSCYWIEGILGCNGDAIGS